MRALLDLEELNGLPVERDLVDGSAEGDGSESEKERFEHLGEIKEVGKETSSGIGGGSEDTPLKNEEQESPGLPEHPSIDQTHMFMGAKRVEGAPASDAGSEQIDDELMRVHDN